MTGIRKVTGIDLKKSTVGWDKAQTFLLNPSINPKINPVKIEMVNEMKTCLRVWNNACKAKGSFNKFKNDLKIINGVGKYKLVGAKTFITKLMDHRNSGNKTNPKVTYILYFLTQLFIQWGFK